ncbi:YuiB family protein [Virgibacillus sediminis]|uniref:YuiB family protein n=1 Tax=Virgibacillus sediminis TaxID=202260 RepID=A0ABV7A2K0_9BACI
MIQIFMSILLYFVIFFGIAFILNMLFRTKWLMAFLYPIIVIMIVDDISTLLYFTDTGEAFSILAERFANIMPMDIVILLSGFAGTIVSGIVIKMLRKRGYQMF